LTVGTWRGYPFKVFELEARGWKIKQMIDQHSYRYYYYYGPLSAWRDGQAKGCRGLII